MIEKTEFRVLSFEASKDNLTVKLQVEPEPVITIEDAPGNILVLPIDRYGIMTELIQECILAANDGKSATLWILPKTKKRRWQFWKK